ncbi:hypothetical protein [Clostridium ganghwense]|uniref:Uncharacterized protein n=1 Tax=Clostridium ganghwense TaxID=312089 RepID=A0ABT4CJG8_9CLOT|nr:hypothetical protein [Clostridium ganghwense]MCY6369063.1 hypothetical protein [Clostridium ganghwense]
MTHSILILYFLFGIFEVATLYKNNKNRELFLYTFLLLLTLVIGTMAYLELIPRHFARVVEFLVKFFT